MITILTTIILSQLTVPPFMGLLEASNMIQRQTGTVDSWNYYYSGNNLTGMGGFRSVAPQQSAQARAKAKAAEKKEEKIECGENCLCTKLKEEDVKNILAFIQQQKERQAQFEKFRQQNPNGGFPPNFGGGNFRGRPQGKQQQSNNVGVD